MYHNIIKSCTKINNYKTFIFRIIDIAYTIFIQINEHHFKLNEKRKYFKKCLLNTYLLNCLDFVHIKHYLLLCI